MRHKMDRSAPVHIRLRRRVPGVNRMFPIVSAGILLLGAARTARADDTWTLGGSGFWDVATNWSSLAVPVTTDNVFNHSTGIISVSNDIAAHYQAVAAGLTNDGGGGVQVINGATLTASGAVSNTNNSFLSSSGVNSTLNLGSSSNSLTNNGSQIFAADMGIVNIGSGSVDNNNAFIQALGGSKVNLTSSILTTENGGGLVSSGSGSLLMIGGMESPLSTITVSGASGIWSQDGGNLVVYANNIDNTGFSSIRATSFLDGNNNPVPGGTAAIFASTFTNDSNSSVSAEDGGSLTLTVTGTLNNQNGASLFATGENYNNVQFQGGSLTVSANAITNDGTGSDIYADQGSSLNISTSSFTNQNNGDIFTGTANTTSGVQNTINLGSSNSYIGTFTNTGSNSSGISTISANNGGTVNIYANTLNNEAGAQFYSSDPGSNLTINTSGAFTNDASLISADNTGTVSIYANTFTNQNAGAVFTGVGTPGGTVNVTANTILNSGSNSSMQAVDGGSLNLNGGSLTIEDGANSWAAGNGTTFNVGTVNAPESTVTLNGSTTVGSTTYWSYLSTSDGATTDVNANNLNVENGAFINTFQSTNSAPLPTLNIGTAAQPVGTISLTNAANAGTSDLNSNGGTINAYATNVTVDGSSQISASGSGILNLGDASHPVQLIGLNGDGNAAFIDASNGGTMTVWAKNINSTNDGILNSYGTGSNLQLNAGTVTNDGTGSVSYIESTGGGAMTVRATTLTNQDGGYIYVSDANSSLNLGTQAAPITTVNNEGTSGSAYAQIGSASADTLQFYATNINNLNGGVIFAGRFSTPSDAGSVTNLGDGSHWVSQLTNDGTSQNGASAVRAHYGSTLNAYVTTVNNQNGAQIYSLQDTTSDGLSGGTLNLTSNTINNSSLASIYSTGSGSHTNVNTATLNNDATLEALSGGITTVTAANIDNTTHGVIYVDGSSSVVINNTNLLNTSGTIQVAKGGNISVAGGIGQTDGSTTVDGTLTASNYLLSGGLLQGTGTLATSVNQTGGTFNPGQDPANLNLTGNYSLSNGTFLEQIASLSSFDTLTLSGSTNITGGILSLDFLNGYHPLLNNSWQFLLPSAGFGSTDQFNSITSNLGAGYGFGYSSGVVKITQVPPAVPEASSVLAMLSIFGTTSGLSVLRRRRKS